jgi:hypothetical protein
MTENSDIKLGDKVKDKLTDLKGTVVATAEYLYGCVWVCVLPSTLKKTENPLKIYGWTKQGWKRFQRENPYMMLPSLKDVVARLFLLPKELFHRLILGIKKEAT